MNKTNDINLEQLDKLINKIMYYDYFTEDEFNSLNFIKKLLTSNENNLKHLYDIITKVTDHADFTVQDMSCLTLIRDKLLENDINIKSTNSDVFGVFINDQLNCPEYITPLESTANRLLKQVIEEDRFDDSFIKKLPIYKIIKDDFCCLYGPVIIQSVTQPSGNDYIEQERINQIKNDKEKSKTILNKIEKMLTDEDFQFIKQKLENI